MNPSSAMALISSRLGRTGSFFSAWLMGSLGLEQPAPPWRAAAPEG